MIRWSKLTHYSVLDSLAAGDAKKPAFSARRTSGLDGEIERRPGK